MDHWSASPVPSQSLFGLPSAEPRAAQGRTWHLHRCQEEMQGEVRGLQRCQGFPGCHWSSRQITREWMQRRSVEHTSQASFPSPLLSLPLPSLTSLFSLPNPRTCTVHCDATGTPVLRGNPTSTQHRNQSPCTTCVSVKMSCQKKTNSLKKCPPHKKIGHKHRIRWLTDAVSFSRKRLLPSSDKHTTFGR